MSGAAGRREGRCVICIQDDGRRSATPEALPVSHMIGEVRSCDQGGGAYKKWDHMTGRWDQKAYVHYIYVCSCNCCNV